MIVVVNSQNLGCVLACYRFSWKRMTFLIEESLLKLVI